MHTACCRLLWATDYDTHSGQKQARVFAEAEGALVRRILQIQSG
jgi:hypothetical protein